MSVSSRNLWPHLAFCSVVLFSAGCGAATIEADGVVIEPLDEPQLLAFWETKDSNQYERFCYEYGRGTGDPRCYQLARKDGYLTVEVGAYSNVKNAEHAEPLERVHVLPWFAYITMDYEECSLIPEPAVGQTIPLHCRQQLTWGFARRPKTDWQCFKNCDVLLGK